MQRTHDVIVIGAGSAGLTAAGGLARLGLKVALVERGLMGGECLNTGCVPSKAMIAAARRAQSMRDAAEVGVRAVEPEIDFADVRAHVRRAIDAIAPHDSEARFRDWGVEVIRGVARFEGRSEIDVEGRRLRAPRIIVATGSEPRIPAIVGLDRTPFLTNLTLFGLDRLPRRLLILGAGAIGMEMAQAFRRLGSEVVVIDHGRALAADDPDAAAVVTDRLRREGVTLLEATTIVRAGATPGGVRLHLESGATLEGDTLLVAVGRASDVAGLCLERAGVVVGEGGIRVNSGRRTSNPRIFAIGDCRDGPRFTHAAGYEGALLVRKLGFGLPGAVDYKALPRVTFTDPELAQVGLTEPEARKQHGRVEVSRQPFTENDRAVVDSRTEGFVKIVRAGRRVVGVTIVGDRAGELLEPWIAAVGGAKATAWALSGLILPYPTMAESSKAAAFALYEPALFGPWARRWARALAALRG